MFSKSVIIFFVAAIFIITFIIIIWILEEYEELKEKIKTLESVNKELRRLLAEEQNSWRKIGNAIETRRPQINQ
jgi:hypothetical protein